MKQIRCLAFLIALLAAAPWGFGDAGIIIPNGQEQPDASVLSLDEMRITLSIDNGDARVFIQQIYANHTGRILEGNYIFALPSRAAISDFAVWDGVTRIPGVILERKRAEEIYDALKWQAIDPGLLQMGERGADEAARSAVFSARIVPIPAFGTKRIMRPFRLRTCNRTLPCPCAPTLTRRKRPVTSASTLSCTPSTHSRISRS
jgi:Ca-activated chloride channel family protein